MLYCFLFHHSSHHALLHCISLRCLCFLIINAGDRKLEVPVLAPTSYSATSRELGANIMKASGSFCSTSSSKSSSSSSSSSSDGPSSCAGICDFDMLVDKAEKNYQNIVDCAGSTVAKDIAPSDYQSSYTDSTMESYLGANVHIQNNQSGEGMDNDGGSDGGGESREEESNDEADSADDNYFAVHSTMDGI
jgi:hypothetical protein